MASKEFKTWRQMFYRCEQPTNPLYPNYGGRGICVADRWRDFENFLADMGPAPTSLHSLDRVDNDGPYSPENCRWASRREQNRNRRSARLFTLDGVTRCLTEWAERAGVAPQTLTDRLRRGLPLDAALQPPTSHGTR